MKCGYIKALSIRIRYGFMLGVACMTTVSADALADVLTGKVNPSAKLTMSFPRYNGQVPIFYNHLHTGNRPGKEIVQLYITDLIASTARPVVELKGFQKLAFKPGETKTVSFTVTPDQLKFYGTDLKFDWESGDFELAIAPNSRDLNKVKVYWEK